MLKKQLSICSAFFFSALLALPLYAAEPGSEKKYELTIDTSTVNAGGKPVEAMLINQQLPGPRLEFTVGDTAVIKVNNKLQSDASIHWHGLLLPQDQDGVPYITFLPIAPDTSFTYRFPITHEGTYWYHSHTNIDEQRGQYGSIVVHPKAATNLQYQYDEVIQLSDWTNENPRQVLANLKKDGEWYAIKKDSVVSIAGYLARNRFGTWLSNRWQRMEGMDVSDVGYDAFLANGKSKLQILPQAKAGDVVRLRFINSGASTYFRIQSGATPFEVIAADGVNVQPVAVREFLMGMAETYDVLVTIPASGSLAINANNIDGSGYASIVLGGDNYLPAPLPEKPDLYQSMDHSGHSAGEHHPAHHTGHLEGHHTGRHKNHRQAASSVHQSLDYSLLKTSEPVSYAGPLREVRLDLTGNMESYNWSFNNTPLSKADKIKINRGEVVRFIFNNQTMMRHPLHLHGHFFKVISGNGDHNVLKHTVDVGPMQTVTIEFAANEYKDWLFHCHNLYHAKTGMARVVRYSDYAGNPGFDAARSKSREIKDNDWYRRADLHLYTNFLQGEFSISNASTALQWGAERRDWQETELEFAAIRMLNRWTQVYLGAEYSGDEEEGEEEKEWEARLGLGYTAPFLIETDVWFEQDGDIEASVETEFQLSKYWLLELGGDTEQDWFVEFDFRPSPRFAVGLGIRDEVDLALGVRLTF